MNDFVEHRFPCQACGSDLRFDPTTSDLVCDHCGESEDIHVQSRKIYELDFRDALDAKLPSSEIEETRVSECPNCGAQVEFDDVNHSTECPFCATPVVTGTGSHRHFKPKGLLPFALDERTARGKMTDWLGALWFAPNGLQAYARKGRKMSGIYVPYWTFDADTKSSYSGQRGTHYYETKTVMRDGKRQQVRVRKTRWRRVTGRVARFFDDVLVLASKSLPKKFTENLEPWDLSELRPYSEEFLAGFRAEGYTIELPVGYEDAWAQMAKVITRDVRFDIGGDAQHISIIDTDVRDVTFKHILLPVWLAAYKYRGKTYRFVINGRTGRVQGERPYSFWKIFFAVVLGLIIAGCVGYVVAMNQ